MITSHFNRITILNFLVSFFVNKNSKCQEIIFENEAIISSIIEHYKISSLSKKASRIANPYKNESLYITIITAVDFFKLKSEVDSSYIEQQLETNLSIKWNKSFLPSSLRLKKKSGTYLSIPLYLNKEKTLALIYHSEYVGPLAAEGHFDLIKTVNMKWIVFGYYPLWIS